MDFRICRHSGSTARADLRAAVFACCFLFILGSFGIAPRAAEPDRAEVLGDCELVRCHFDEGRIVVRYEGTLHVLSAGELFPDGLHRVQSITEKQVVLEKTDPRFEDAEWRSTAPGGMVLITQKDGGGISIQVLSDRPQEPPRALPLPAESPASTGETGAAVKKSVGAGGEKEGKEKTP